MNEEVLVKIVKKNGKITFETNPRALSKLRTIEWFDLLATARILEDFILREIYSQE